MSGIFDPPDDASPALRRSLLEAEVCSLLTSADYHSEVAARYAQEGAPDRWIERRLRISNRFRERADWLADSLWPLA